MNYRPLICALLLMLVGVGTYAQFPTPERVRGLDWEFVQLAGQFPGFGGYFLDADGNLHINMKQGATVDDVAEIVSDRVRDRIVGRPRRTTPETLIHRTRYDFLELEAWRTRLRTALSPQSPGVQFIDIDEATNRIRVGVTTQAAQNDVNALVPAVGIASDAISVELVPSGRPIATLADPVRPVEAGHRLEYGAGLYCTVGLNVYYSNIGVGVPVGTRGFLTASHCTSTLFGTDGRSFYQGSTLIGTEIWDPPYFTSAQNSACPPGGVCRWSDVAFGAYETSVSSALGSMARPATQVWGRGWPTPPQTSTVVDPLFPSFAITQTALVAYNSTVEKIGQTTGWTAGSVTQTCSDWNWYGEWRLCQDKVDAFADDGDSGAPAFVRNGDSTVAFAGIVWFKDFGGFVFSSVQRIQDDFGIGLTYF